MKLFICDDNQQFAEKLKSDILSINADCEVTLFSTISSLLFMLEDKGSRIDGIFLDIKNTDGNGIDAAMKIKAKYPLIRLVFVTGYGDEYSQDIFNCSTGYRPVAFLLKPVKEKYLKIALEKISDTTIKSERYIQIAYNRTTTFINEKDIIYISSDKRKLTIYTVNESFTYYDKLDSLLRRLGDNFCRCHKSYVVNFDYINSVENWHSIIMYNRISILIGNTYLNNFKSKLVAYKASNQKEE